MKKSFCTLLLCSSLISNSAQATPIAFLLRPLTGLFGATAAAGAGITTWLCTGTTAALGEADELKEEGEEITLRHIAAVWALQLKRTQKGFNIAYEAVTDALNKAEEVSVLPENPPVTPPKTN